MSSMGGLLQGQRVVPPTAMASQAQTHARAALSRRCAEGQYTTTIYKLIKEEKYEEVVHLLSMELQDHPTSRGALSLLGFCYYHMEDFVQAAKCYEKLSKKYPKIEQYRVYHAQSLFKAQQYSDASKVALAVESPEYEQKMQLLQANVKYETEDLAGARQILRQCDEDDVSIVMSEACILYKEGKFEEAREKYIYAMNSIGFRADIVYSIGLCSYKMGLYGHSMKMVNQVVERSSQEHPELSVGTGSEGVEVRSVGNSLALRQSALIEAFNLMAAIHYVVKNYDDAREALLDMPPRAENELDAVSLHNTALVNMETDPDSGFEKLTFLLQQNPCPPETFGNLLLLYCKYAYYDLAADILAENSHLTYKYLSDDVFQFIDTLILQQSSPEEAFTRFDALAAKHVDTLRKLTKEVQDQRNHREPETVKAAIKAYDLAVESYLPVLMAQAKICWDRHNYLAVEKIFKAASEFTSECDVWRLNLAHVFFMQDSKYQEAIRYYEPIVKDQMDNLLGVTAIVLANLCVSYIMINQNEEAEDLMRLVEKEEENLLYQDHTAQAFHLCIINLVIGTLYCAKNNYEFGISRIVRALEPFSKKLGTDTWYYAKRCLLALASQYAFQSLLITDVTFNEVLSFLDHVAAHGKHVPAVTPGSDEEAALEDPLYNSVAYEARVLKALFLKIKGF
eukprot:GCRY01003651.1.p1 GENE.GCRY01003651.1~~GCRY01003651.1.p1  ORF type:complete len:680 (+),score=215.12 GCRY01003651.1:245-2284(+)